MVNIYSLIILLFVYSCNSSPLKITQNDLKKHIKYLSSDKLEGRKAGTEKERISAQYIAKYFNKASLKDFDENYLQKFNFASGLVLSSRNEMGLSDLTLEPGVDFLPLGFSSSASCSASVIFAGYGITGDELNYNDYKNINVQDKIVLALRYSPEFNNPHINIEEHESLRKKAMIARENGARGFILVDGNPEAENTALKKLKTDKSYSDIGIPVVQITREIADFLLIQLKTSISQLQDSIVYNKNPAPISFDTGLIAVINTDIEKTIVESQNVIGFIPGSGNLMEEFIVVGAHYDHLGWGGEGSGSLDPDAHAVHNGADDNGSGTSSLLELAEYFSMVNINSINRRGLIFAAFGGEEEGLLGSSHFVDNPPVNINNIAAMLNMDMIGRLEENKLVVGGTGTSSVWHELLNNLNEDSLHLSFDEEGFGASDHQSFYLKDIPVIFFFTGAHSDYHRPSDDIDKINFSGLQLITEYIKRITKQLITMEIKPDFQKVESERKSRTGFSVYVGTIPDYTFEGTGMRLNGIREKGPGGKAGLKTGDIMLKFGETEILSIYDYMYALQDAKPETPVQVIIDRGGTTLTLTIIPEKRKE